MIAFDDDVDDALHRRSRKAIQSLLARQTPVASDLRLVLAMLHINLHLERMADYCVTIAKLSKLVPEVEPCAALHRGLRGDGSALRRDDPHCAATHSRTATSRGAEVLVELDELVDRANRRVVERILELGGAAEDARVRLRMALVSRALERIGDHAVDIGEQIAYLLTGSSGGSRTPSHSVPRDG